MGFDIRIYFLLFMIYAVLGWCMEVMCKLIQYKRFINRGFLIGPYCPIYGYGAILITFLLEKYTNDPIALFIMAILICGILEYLTSYFIEKVFKARWWDYSSKKFNINGRVCLNTIIPFGVLGLLIMYVFNPFFISQINKMPTIVLTILSITLSIVYIADNIVSFVVMTFIKKTEIIVEKDLDNTEEITKKVTEILRRKSILHRRLINAYPTLKAIKIKVKKEKQKLEAEIKESKEKIKAKAEDTKNAIETKIENGKEEIENKIKNNIEKIDDKTENNK